MILDQFNLQNFCKGACFRAGIVQCTSVVRSSYCHPLKHRGCIFLCPRKARKSNRKNNARSLFESTKALVATTRASSVPTLKRGRQEQVIKNPDEFKFDWQSTCYRPHVPQERKKSKRLPEGWFFYTCKCVFCHILLHWLERKSK